MDHKPNKPSKSAMVVVLLLVVQLIILGMSFSGYDTISIFCSVPDKVGTEWVYWLHPVYGILLIVGLASLEWNRLRVIYIVLISVALPLLFLQSSMAERGLIHCDGF